MKQDKPKLLMIGPLPPPVHGSAMMTQYIKDSKLINESFNLDWINLSTSRNMSEIGKKSPKKIFRFLNSYLKTFYKLCTNRYDLCYLAITCHGNGFLKDAPFVLLCKVFGHKLIIHQHNKGMSADVDKPFFKKLFSLVYRNSAVILLSWRLYPDIEKIVKKDQVYICPNGIPPIKLYTKNEEPHIPQMLFLSNLIESKGVFVLLDACKILYEQGYVFQCKFVGGETKEIDASKFEKEVEKRGLNNIVIYVGKKYNEEKDKEFASSDVFVFPTFYKNECFPLVILEAIQQETPVVSTNEGGIPDIIKDGENGFLCKTHDSNDLASKIKWLFDNPEKLKEIGQKGFETYKQQYTIQKWERCLINIISQFME